MHLCVEQLLTSLGTVQTVTIPHGPLHFSLGASHNVHIQPTPNGDLNLSALDMAFSLLGNANTRLVGMILRRRMSKLLSPISAGNGRITALHAHTPAITTVAVAPDHKFLGSREARSRQPCYHSSASTD